MDGRTDGPTNRVTYCVVCTHLKIINEEKKFDYEVVKANKTVGEANKE